MKNKKAMSIPIVLLVILTIVLTTVSLFQFNIREKGIKEEILIPNILDEIYIQEVQLNYYLQEIFEKSAKKEISKEQFIDNFIGELDKYDFIENKDEIKKQIVDGNVVLTPDKISLRLDIELTREQEVDEKEIIGVKYNYQKSFEKSLVEKDL